MQFSNRWGNVAGVLGVVITIAGFTATAIGFIWTTNEQKRTHQAIDRVVAKSASREMTGTLDWIERSLRKLIKSADDSDWGSARQNCRRAERGFNRLRSDPHLTAVEYTSVGDAIDELRLIDRYIVNRKLSRPDPGKDFHKPKRDAIDSSLDLVTSIRSRLRQILTEI